MLETKNPRLNSIIYVISFIVLISMTLWMGVFVAWLSGVFSGGRGGISGVQPDFLDYIRALLTIVLPYIVYFIGKKKRNIAICILASIMPYVLNSSLLYFILG